MEHKKSCSKFYDNSTIIIYQLLCTIIIPIIIFSGNKDYMHYYSFVLVCFSTILTYAGHRDIFSNLYTDNCTSPVSFVSTGLINIVAFLGILFSTVHYMNRNNNIFDVVLYGFVLFTFTFIVSKTILLYILKQVDGYCKSRKLVKQQENWHKILSGLIYLLVFLIIYVLIIDSFKSGISSKSTPSVSVSTSTTMNKITKTNSKPMNNKPNQVKPNQVKPNQVKPNQVKPNTEKLNRDKVNQVKLNSVKQVNQTSNKLNSGKNKTPEFLTPETKISPQNLIKKITINNKRNVIKKTKK